MKDTLSGQGLYAGEVAARLDRLPFTRTLWRFVTLIALGGAFELYDLFMTAYISPGLVRSGLFSATAPSFFSPHGVGFFVFSFFAGMWVGTIGFGFIADRLGRRSIFTVSLVWYSLATLVMAFQQTPEMVCLWRFIAAIGIGLEQITIDTFLPELVPPAGRGKAFAYYQFIEFLVVPVVALLGWLLVPKMPLGLDGWRWVAIIGSVGALFAWVFRLTLPESPRWLALHGKKDKAAGDHAAHRGGGGEGHRRSAAAAPTCGRGITRQEHLRRTAAPARYGKRTLVLSIFNLTQTIAFYGFGSWVPTLLIAKGIHVTTSLMYSSFIIALANPVGPLLGMLVMADRMERKWQLVSAGVCVGLFITLFSLGVSPFWVIVFGVGVTLSNNWISFVFHGYQAEQYPTRIRARGVGFVYSWSRVSSALQGLLIGFFLKEGGDLGVAAFIGVAMLIMCGTVGLFGERTRNRSLEELSR